MEGSSMRKFSPELAVRCDLRRAICKSKLISCETILKPELMTSAAELEFQAALYVYNEAMAEGAYSGLSPDEFLKKVTDKNYIAEMCYHFQYLGQLQLEKDKRAAPSKNANDRGKENEITDANDEKNGGDDDNDEEKVTEQTELNVQMKLDAALRALSIGVQGKTND